MVFPAIRRSEQAGRRQRASARDVARIMPWGAICPSIQLPGRIVTAVRTVEPLGGQRHVKPEDRRGFVTTRWSIVVAAGARTGASEEALATLCGTYWYALYAYVRRCGYDVEQAEDVVQGFFLRLLDRGILRHAQPERGRFRSFLLASLKHFMINEYDRARAVKRGGGTAPLTLDVTAAEGRYALEPKDALDPERLYERRWAQTLLRQAHVRLRGASVRSE